LKEFRINFKKKNEILKRNENENELNRMKNLNEIDNLKENELNKIKNLNVLDNLKEIKQNGKKKLFNRRKSNRFIIRESDAFMDGPWIMEEENEDENLNNKEIKILENEITEREYKIKGKEAVIEENNSIIKNESNENNKRKLKDVKMDHLQKKNFKKIIKELKNNDRKSCNNVKENTDNDIKKPKSTEKKSIFTKIFGLFRNKRVKTSHTFDSNINNNNCDNTSQNKDNSKNENEINKGVLSSSSASSVSDSDDNESMSNKDINETNINDNIPTIILESTDTVTIENQINYNKSENQNNINTILLDQIEKYDSPKSIINDKDINDKDINDKNYESNVNNFYDNIKNSYLNYLNENLKINRSHSMCITEKEKIDYLSNMNIHKKRKRENYIIKNFNEIYQNSAIKRNKTDIDEIENFTFNNNNDSIINNIQNEKIDEDYNYTKQISNNKKQDISSLLCIESDSSYNSTGSVLRDNEILELTNNQNNSYKKKKLSKLVNNTNKINFINNLDNNNNNNNKGNMQSSNEKLSFIQIDYDFSKVDECFDNVFSDDKTVPLNKIPLNPMFNESTIYPVINNSNFLGTPIINDNNDNNSNLKNNLNENVLNSTIIKNIIPTLNENINDSNKKNYSIEFDDVTPTKIIDDNNIENSNGSNKDVFNNFNIDQNENDVVEEDMNFIINNKTIEELKNTMLNIKEEEILNILDADFDDNRYLI